MRAQRAAGAHVAAAAAAVFTGENIQMLGELKWEKKKSKAGRKSLQIKQVGLSSPTAEQLAAEEKMNGSMTLAGNHCQVD